MNEKTKLYVITRRDLPPGAQAAQASHAAIEFALTHPELTRQWHDLSNNIVLLSVPDEVALDKVLRSAAALESEGVLAVFFREPDFGDSLTAVALHGDYVHRLVSSLPKALKRAQEPPNELVATAWTGHAEPYR